MFDIVIAIIAICLVIVTIWIYGSLHIASREFHKSWDKMTPKQQIEVLENLKEEDKEKFINIYYGRLWK